MARSEVTELFEFNITARWNGLEMRVVDQWNDAKSQAVHRVTYLGHNADLAEGLRLEKFAAGVYEASIVGSLQDVTTTQLIPSSWAAPASA